MKKNYFLTFLTVFFFNLFFAQKPPLPPTPEEVKNYSKNPPKEPVKIIELSENKNYNPNKTVQKAIRNSVPKFKISISQSTDVNSVYYFKNIESRIAKQDTTLTAEQIISLTQYKKYTKAINPSLLDSLANKTYKFNENKQYEDAIKTAQQMLQESPNNITAQKEIAYAYKYLEKKELSDLHFAMMVKIMKSVIKYSDGTRENPYILNNFFEGLSIYEATLRCMPKKISLRLTTDKKLLGAYDCFHIVNFSDLTHWLPYLKKEDYHTE